MIRISRLRNNFWSYLFVFCFVLPHIFISILPSSFTSIIYFILFLVYLVLGINFFKKFNYRFNYRLIIFTTSFFFLGLITQVFKMNFSFLNLTLPFVAFIGFEYLLRHQINTVVFRICLIFMYIYFYFVYFSIIPDLFFRPGFDEDEVVFDLSSSNAIPMALNITLYVYFILNKFYGVEKKKEIVFFSIINLALAVIQQSRIGILVSIVMIIIIFLI